MPHSAPSLITGFNIAEFSAQIQTKYVLKPTKWCMQTAVPAGLIGKSEDITAAARELKFWAATASIPGVTFATHDVFRYGYGVPVKYPYSPAFAPMQVTFICDGLGQEWKFFKDWLNIVIFYQGALQGSQGITGANPNNPNQVLYEVGYPEDYNMDYMTFTAFVDSGEEILKIQLREAYPCSVSDMKMDWNDKGGPSSFNVVFNYTDWTYFPKTQNA